MEEIPRGASMQDKRQLLTPLFKSERENIFLLNEEQRTELKAFLHF